MARTLPAGILLLGDDLPFLVELSTAPRSIRRIVVIAAAPGAVRRLGEASSETPAAAVICFEGSENLEDVHAAKETCPATKFLFLSTPPPPRAALARRSIATETRSSPAGKAIS